MLNVLLGNIYNLVTEVGHNWGSQHDTDTPECNPPFSENGGKYIMYASVVSGNEPNNKVMEDSNSLY